MLMNSEKSEEFTAAGEKREIHIWKAEIITSVMHHEE